MPQTKSKGKNLDTNLSDKIDKLSATLEKLNQAFKIESTRSFFRELGAVLFTISVAITTFALSLAQFKTVSNVIASYLIAITGLAFIYQSVALKNPFKDRRIGRWHLIQYSIQSFPIAFVGIVLGLIAFIILGISLV